MLNEFWAKYLCCPHDQGALELVAAKSTSTESLLRCRQCGANYGTDEGIFDFSTSIVNDYDRVVKAAEIQARDQHADEYDSMFSKVQQTLEERPGLRLLSPQRSDIVAELGCGTGRMTMSLLPAVQRVLAVDFSMNSLRVLMRRLPREFKDKVLPVRADITSLPLAAGAFDKIASFQVLEHVPSAEGRKRVADEISRILKPGGTLVMSVYNWSARKKRLHRQGVGDNTSKEGFHNSGIYYFNFEPDELRSLLTAGGLTVGELHGVRIACRGSFRLGKLMIPVESLTSRSRFALREGELLMVSATKVA